MENMMPVVKEELKSNFERLNEAEAAVEIRLLKAINAQYADAQRHMSVARKRWSTMLSDRRYAASGYVGDPDVNLVKSLEKLREIQKTLLEVENAPNLPSYKSENMN
jgi:hypothetical protein